MNVKRIQTTSWREGERISVEILRSPQPTRLADALRQGVTTRVSRTRYARLAVSSQICAAATRRSEWFQSVRWLCVTFLLLVAAGSAGRAQSTNSPARVDYQTFRLISERNIFDPNRSSRSGGVRQSRPTIAVSFALVGTLSYEKGNVAFFVGTDSSYRKDLKTGDTIAGYRIAEITANRVKLMADNQVVELGVGMQMRRQDAGEWQLAGRAESFSDSSATTASTDKTDAAPAEGAANDVLKKLIQQREQELK